MNLQAEWEPNTINVKWYNDTEENGATTPSTTNTCSYSGALTVPVAPAKKTGYTFAGWRLRAPEAFNLTTLLAQRGGCDSWAKGYYNSADRCTRPDCQDDINSENCSGANYADLNRYEWKVPLYEGGMLYGESSCNGIQGTSYFSGWMCYEYSNDARAADSMSVNDTGRYCWCRATGYKVSGENKQSVTPSQWFYHRDFANANSCANDCAARCASYIVLDYSGWLERLLGQDYTCTE